MTVSHRLVLALLLCAPLLAQTPYRTPPQAIVDCVDAPPPPQPSLSPARTHLLLIERESLPSIEALAAPVLGLAGLRIDPATRGPQRRARARAFTLVTIADGARRALAVPDADLGAPIWSADGARFAFTATFDDRIELWVADVAQAQCKHIDGVLLVAVLGAPVRWMPDQQTLLCKLVATGAAPARGPAPAGPAVQVTSGRQTPVRTYQDLLENAHDAALFEHYATCQLAAVDPRNGAVRRIGAPGLYDDAAPSPDGRWLLVERMQRPFSYLLPAGSFPREIAIWDRNGKPVRTIARVPLAEGIPIDGVRAGPRSVEWQPTADATLLWTEALDGGDPAQQVEHRDALLRLAAPFDGEPRTWLRARHRLWNVAFAASNELALLTEFDRDERWIWIARFDPREERPVLAPVHDRSMQDAYRDIGRPVTRLTARGTRVLHEHGGRLFLEGRGASPQGDRPFLDARDLNSGASQRLFACGEERYEEVLGLLADDGSELLVERESRTEPQNVFVVRTATGASRALTSYRDAAAERTAGIARQRLRYARADGVDLTGTLYLPPGAREGEPLPLLVWAYPREYTSTDTAGQVRGSTHRYARLAGTSPLLLTLAGYAVLDDAAMPVVGPTETANDTFVEQIVADAQAAIDAVVALGVADRDRVAIAGHSYGAFMTANLLAHCDLFRAGIARSGAYNRTLTPFGFQNERRTLWQAPHIYSAMSPFMHADEIDEPLLLIHGTDDNNAGTFPIQSQRLFHAIEGHGGHARLVMLPHESHGYAARESVLHCLAEMVDWLDTHVKNAAAPTPVESTGRRRG
jgi:dipeptidyl aminopeptidase/acylaminoacyl peptidase